MILKPGNPWGFITGKLSMNPEQALRMFDFVMNPEAHGVILRVYNMADDNGRTRKVNIISNYFPPSNPQTPAQQERRYKMRDAVHHWQELGPSARREYNKIASRRKLQMSGFNYHNSLFMRNAI